MVAKPTPHHPLRVTRGFFLASGLSLVALAAVGIVVPGWPTTIFCILALYCFKRSSARLENWLLNHPLVGPTLRDWDENKWMSLRAKILALSVMWASMAASCLLIKKSVPIAIILVCGIGVSVFIWTRRTKPSDRVPR